MKFTRSTNEEIREDYVYNLLLNRGILHGNEVEKEKYYSPSPSNLISLEKIEGIEEVYNLIIGHIKKGSHIHIIVDSDVDGFTSSGILYNYLDKEIHKIFPDFEISYRIPNGKEHGLKTIIEEYLGTKRYDLVILPDGGTNDVEECRLLYELGYEVAIIDHHLRSKENIYATIINNQISKNYDNKDLSGVGMVYKFISYCDQKLGLNIADQYLDLVALGEISDMMDINTLENRYLIAQGLSHINNAFFKKIIEKQKFFIKGGTPTQIDISFYVSPLLNALIRMGEKEEKEELFLCLVNEKNDENEENSIDQCIKNCMRSKRIQDKEKKQAAEMLKIEIFNKELDQHKILILNADNIEISTKLTGLVAMEVASNYKLPTLLGRTTENNELKGSIRGLETSEIKDFRTFLLNSNLMEYVEGHSNAAGFSIKIKNIDKLLNYADKKLANVDFNQGVYEVDFIRNEKDNDIQKLIYEICKYKDFWGFKNKEPLIAFTDIVLPRKQIQMMGKNKDTVKFSMNSIEYIKFKDKNLVNKLINSKCQFYNINCIGKCSINEWNGIRKPQIILESIELNEI